MGKIGPAILTGEGVRTARLRRAWWLISIAAITLLGGCSWLVLHHSPAREAIITFSSAVEGARSRTDRIAAIQERLADRPAAGRHRGAGDGRPRRRAHRLPHLIKLAAAKPLFDQVKGMVLSARVPLWMPKAAQLDLESRIEEGMSEQRAVATLLKAGKGAIDFHDWERRLQDAGLGADGVEAIDLLLRGRTKTSGENAFAKRLLAGDLPTAIVLTAFAGRKGAMWINGGQHYALRTVEYKGSLLQFSDPGWPAEVRVLSLSTTMAAGQ